MPAGWGTVLAKPLTLQLQPLQSSSAPTKTQPCCRATAILVLTSTGSGLAGLSPPEPETACPYLWPLGQGGGLWGGSAPPGTKPSTVPDHFTCQLCLDPAGPTLLCKGRGWGQSLPHAPSTLYPIRDMLMLQDTRHHVRFLPARPGWRMGNSGSPGGLAGGPPLHAQCNSPQAKAQPCPSQPQAPGPAIPKELAVVLKLVFL